MNANTAAHLAAHILDSASTTNERQIGARILARTVEADAGMLAGLSGADILDFVTGICDGGGIAFALSSVAAALRSGVVSADAYLDALCAGTDAAGEAIDADTERAHRVIALAGLAA